MPVHYKIDLTEKPKAYLMKGLFTPCHISNNELAKLVPEKNGKLLLVLNYTRAIEKTVK